jgi:hypothetical protein
MNDDAIFSPSETESYMRCPAYHRYQHRWQPRAPWTPNRLLGDAVHAGLAAHYGRPMSTPLAVALNVLAAGFPADEAHYTLDGLRTLVEKGLTAGIAMDAPNGGVVIATEQLLSRTKIDMVQRRPGEGLSVVDWKVSLELEKPKLKYRLREYDTSWQLRHEAWAASEHFGEPVEWGYIGIIALTPRVFTHLHPVAMGAERLAHWERSAWQWWARLAAARANERPEMNLGACDRFGGCVFKAACHDLHGDESRFETFYTPREEW